jgi:AcrR family transcriptional regulator
MFAAKGYDGVSLRGLADAAGVTPAMIHYYFKNKDGLYTAMLEDVTGRILSQIEAAAARGASEDPFKTIMNIASATVMAEPWAVTLILRDVLLQPGPMRDHFIETYADKILPLVGLILADGKAKGEIRQDLDEKFAAISLLGITAFPFIARGIVEPALKLTYSEDMRRDYVDHAARLFREGINVSQEPTCPKRG